MYALDPTVAQAHGRPQSLNSLRFDRADPSHLVAQGTWGAAVSTDGATSWQWLCAASFGVDARVEDAQLELGAEGRILLGTFGGLLVSDAAGCDFGVASEELSGRWTTAFARHPTAPKTIVAITTDVADDDQLWRSIDEGLTWTRWGQAVNDTLIHALAIAPSDPNRVYIGAAMPDTPSRFFLYRSDDMGQTLADIGFSPTEDGERLVTPLAVDPLDANILYAQVLHFNGETAPERLVRSADGGNTWATVARLSQITDVVIGDDGQTVWTASKTGGVLRSDDRGLTFNEVTAALPTRCLTLHEGALYACFDQRIAGFALARSDDGGQTWTPLLRLDDINQMRACPKCSSVGSICPAWEPDVAFDLGLSTTAPDGGTGLPRDPDPNTTCTDSGCQATHRQAPNKTALFLLALVFLLAGRLARHQTQKSRALSDPAS